MEFQKYSGAGNKFIIFNNLEDGIQNRSEIVINSFKNGNNDEIDGVIFLEKSSLGDFSMNYYNRDGTSDSLCGNGLRCTVKYALDNGLTDKSKLDIESIGKIFSCEVVSSETISVMFPPPDIIRSDIKLKVNFSGWSEDLECSYVNVGTPHIVIFVDAIGDRNLSLEDVNVEEWGRNVRMHKDLMPEGTNVNFIEISGTEKTAISMRTYERGVERETLACGTGALACGIASFTVKGIEPPVDILARSGELLTVNFGHNLDEIGPLTLAGPAMKI